MDTKCKTTKNQIIMTFNQTERQEAEKSLKERIAYLSDKQLAQLLKTTHEPSGEEIRADIEKHSSKIR